jgi:aspartate-semialdehyde dehydrogenase
MILPEIRSLLQSAPGVVLVDDPSTQQYPMPMDAHEKDEVFVGRLRRDETQPKDLEHVGRFQIILEKALPTNAVQDRRVFTCEKFIGLI